MGEVSAIEWTDATWNPWRGCDKVSPGCAHCYMFAEQRRYGRDPEVVVRTTPQTFNAPLSKKWAEQQRAIRLEKDRSMLVFTCSWSDFFHETADPWRAEAWNIIRQTPGMIYQVLTKRPERIAECLPPDWGAGWPNVWLGTTIENRRFVSRAAVLGEIPAAVRFISAEPLLGPLIPERITTFLSPGEPLEATGSFRAKPWPGPGTTYHWKDDYTGPSLPFYNSSSELAFDWLICGGESGPGHRPFDLEWARDLRDVCAREGVEFFLKQLGGPSGNKQGGDQALLDGRRHLGMPEPQSLDAEQIAYQLLADA